MRGAARQLLGRGVRRAVGADVGELAASAGEADPRAAVEALAGDLHELVRALVEVPVPVVAAVRGWAAGAGMSLALAADIAIAGVSTRLRPAYPAIGLSPDGGLTWTLPRAVGAARARHILLTDRVIDADEALALGLVATVVADEEVAAEAEADFDPIELVYPGEIPYFDKYDELLPAELVRKGFAEGVLDISGMRARVLEWRDRWGRAPL